MPEMAPSAPSRKEAMSDIVKDDSTATGRPLARIARRLRSKDTASFDQSLTPATCGISQRRASVSGA